MKLSKSLLPLLLLAAACGGSKTPDLPPAGDFPAAGEAARTVIKAPGQAGKALRYTPKAGVSDKVDISADINVSGGGGGESIDMGFGMNLEGEVAIPSVEANGSFKQTMEITGAKVELKGKLAEMGADGGMVGDVMKGMKMSFDIDPQGRLLKADMDGGNAAMMGQMQAGLDTAMQGGVVPFPTEPVGVGASWDSLATIDMMGAKVRMVSSYKLVSLEGTKGRLELTMKGGADAQKMAMPNVPGEVDLKSMGIEATGTVDFDLERPSAGKVEMTMTMAMDISAQGQSGSMKMATKIKAAPRS